ncbi:MAG: sigma-54-dependent Fis family transcriptional regulator [Desulfobacteraceae bacterium]|nr:sigma-54-dependent Fis family transcriptional regulator [Desulfobacteraceae bacterium]
MAQFLIVDDDPKIVLFLSELVENWGHSSDSAHTIKDGLALSIKNNFDIVLLDLELPDGNALSVLPDIVRSSSHPEVIIITGTGGLNGAKLAFKHGAWDYVQKPFIMEEVYLPVSRALEYRKEKTKNETIVLKRGKIIGESAVIHHCLDAIATSSRTNVSVLITGETGTGKELIARSIHENSRRSEGPFVPINCGAVPESLAESIFFGHEKGAFTGADMKKQGLVAQADGGTLFLDEIGELPRHIQISLLRVLQEKCIRPVGAKKEINVDFRLVSATNRDLKEMAAQKRFRQDLLFRIHSMTIDLPPLRERGNDLEEIAIYQIQKICKDYEVEIKGISPEFISILNSNHWPGNVRELINVLEAAVATVGSDPTLYPKHLPPEYRTAALGIEPDPQKMGSKTVVPDVEDKKEISEQIPIFSKYRFDSEKKYLQTLIQKAKGDRKLACRISNISQARLYELLKKHNLSFNRRF